MRLCTVLRLTAGRNEVLKWPVKKIQWDADEGYPNRPDRLWHSRGGGGAVAHRAAGVAGSAFGSSPDPEEGG